MKKGLIPLLTTGAEGKLNDQMKNRIKPAAREDGLLSKVEVRKRALDHVTTRRSLNGAGQVTAWK